MSCRSARVVFGPEHVLGDAGLADLDLALEQLAVNAWRTLEAKALAMTADDGGRFTM